jgi:hypothetical protein
MQSALQGAALALRVSVSRRRLRNRPGDDKSSNGCHFRICPWRTTMACWLILVGACSGQQTPLVLTPSEVAVPANEPAISHSVASEPPYNVPHYEIHSNLGKKFLVYKEHDNVHRLPITWPDSAYLQLLNVTTNSGTRTYLYETRYTAFVVSYTYDSSTLFEIRDSGLTKITATDRFGILLMQKGHPMSNLYVDFNGDIYALDPDQILKVVRDGRIVASTDTKKLSPTLWGDMHRYLFMYRNGDDRILAVIKPQSFSYPRGFKNNRPQEEDIDFKFLVTTP